MNRFQIAWRNLKRRKLRTLLTFLSIIIGVASTFAVTASVDTAKRTFPLYLQAAFGKADYIVSGTEAYMPEEVFGPFEKLEHTASIAVLKQTTKLHLDQDGISDIQKRIELSGYSRLDTTLSNFQVVKGSLTSGGAVITDRTAKAWHTHVGDTISFETDNGVKRIQVAAIVKYTVELMGPSSWMMAKYHHWSAAVPLPVLQSWFGLSGKIENIQIKSLGDSDKETVAHDAGELVKSYGNMYMQPVLIDFGSVSDSGTFFLALYLAGFLGIALSGFIIFNSLYVSVKERKQEFAVLKTIGYLPEQLRSFVLMEVTLLSVAGTAAGLIIGYGFSLLLTKLIYMVFSIYDGGSMVLYKGFAIAVLAGILVPFAAALVPIRQVGKVTVTEALRPKRSKTISSAWLALYGCFFIGISFFIKHLLLIVPLMIGIALVYPYVFHLFMSIVQPIYRRLFGVSGQLASSNVRRNLGRSAMTSVILCWGIAMVVLMSSMNSAFVQSYERVVFASYGGNLDVRFHHTEATDPEQIKKIAGVADAKAYTFYSAIWDLNGQQRKLPVFGVGAAWIDRFPLFAGSGTSRSELVKRLGPGEIILDNSAYAAWGGKIGESIELNTQQGKRLFKVAAVVSTMKNGGYGAFMKEEAFQANFGIKYAKNILVLNDRVTSPLQMRENIFGQFGERIEEMFGPEDIVAMVGSMYTGSFSVINGLVILSIMISGLGITNTLLINILERIRELGMMRAVGVARRQVVGMIMLEGFGIGLAATVAGCIFGILLVYMTSTFVEIRSLTYRFEISWIIILCIAVFGIAVSLVSSFMPASRAAKTPLSEALRYE